MAEIVGVRFKKAGRIYYFDAAGIDLEVNDRVVVETTHGLELGYVVISPKQVLVNEITAPLKPVVRKAEEEDIKRAQETASKEEEALTECGKMITQLNLPMKLLSAEYNQETASKEEEALTECGKMITQLNLPMKLLSAEYNLDESRLTFFFSAEERVDFRELVRKLTNRFKTKVELRQIGPRDAAKLVGGYGRCGRPLCCGSFLSEFTPVSIRMAKEQNLPLNPMKISGLCGRLLCCLGYENEQYQIMKDKLPKEGQQVSTPLGVASVIGGNPLKETVSVELKSGAVTELPLSEVTIQDMEPGKQEKTD